MTSTPSPRPSASPSDGVAVAEKERHSSRSAVPSCASPAIRYLPVWRRDDEGVMRDAVEMWRAEGVLPKGVDPAERAKELVIAIYDGETLAGCLTASIHPFRELGENFAFARSFIRPAWRRARLTDRLMIDGHAELGRWAATHPEERLAGSAAIYQNFRLGTHPVEPSGLALIGFTSTGLQQRVLWFDHYRLPAGDRLATYRGSSDEMPAWRLTPVDSDHALRDAASRFWREQRAFAPETDLDEPAAALSVVAHVGDEMIATSTLRVAHYPKLRRRFAVFRCFVAPQWQDSGIHEVLAAENFRLMEKKAGDGGAEAPVGMLRVCGGYQASALPVDEAGFVLAGYTPQHEQIRLRWFGNVTIQTGR